jgi:hypothetical protein
VPGPRGHCSKGKAGGARSDQHYGSEIGELGARGVVGFLEDRRIMQDDQAAQDAAMVLASLATNHPEAMRGTAFTLSEDEPHRVIATWMNASPAEHSRS